MSKKPKSILLRLGHCLVELNACGEKNYYIGAVVVADSRQSSISIHVEVLPVCRRCCGTIVTKNARYQGRLDAWRSINADVDEPEFLKIPGLGKCFVSITAFAR